MRVSFPGGKRVDAHFDGFTIQTDQSVAGGGEASAPEPFATFLASLATCAGIYVLGFCQARELPTEGISLTQTTERDPETKLLSRVKIDIHVPPGFPEQYHTALQRVANKCLVKRTILEPPEFEIATVVDPA
ncbi:MAG: OsmC family protein [Deltaproteobacteria bacterium]|nr:OsmC family protein [Deltaproteobacteria bacterium]